MRVERDPLVLRRDLTRGKVDAAEIRDPPGAVDNAIGLDCVLGPGLFVDDAEAVPRALDALDLASQRLLQAATIQQFRQRIEQREFLQRRICQLQLFRHARQVTHAVMPFHGVTDGAHERLSVDRIFDQIVFRAALQRLECELFVGAGGQYHHRNLGNAVLQRGERLQSVRIRKSEIENDQIDMPGVDQMTRLLDPCGVRDFEIGCGACQEFGEHSRVAFVIFNNQQACCRRGDGRYQRGHRTYK